MEKTLGILADDGAPQQGRIPPLAESLGAIAVGHAAALEHLEDGLARDKGRLVHAPDTNRETVATQVPDLEPLVVPLGPHDANIRQIKPGHQIGPDAVYGEHLSSDSPGILVTGVADASRWHSEGTGKDSYSMEGGDPFLADFKERMLPRATRSIQGDLLYQEILNPLLDCAADARQILRKIAFRQYVPPMLGHQTVMGLLSAPRRYCFRGHARPSSRVLRNASSLPGSRCAHLPTVPTGS